MAEESQVIVAQKAHIEISDKNMKAFLVFDEPINEGIQFPARDINKLIDDAKIKFGIIKEEIQAISEGKRGGARFLIAEGILPARGKDASFEYFFATDCSFKPKISDDGRIDYKEVNIVNSVTKDSVLIKKIPAVPGTTGMNVLGYPQTPVPSKNYEISIGGGAYRDPKDNNIIKSSFDGIIFFNDKTRSLEVQKLYLIPKSVDYSTGNINVKSSVEIRGDVKPYFSVTTPYNVQVNGLVDNAAINCDGSLSVAGGIVGDGKQLIKAGLDLHSPYIQNHRVRCCGSVYVTTEIRNSLIDCADEIIATGENGLIIGGKVSAANKITSAIIGNSYEVRTEVEVGVKLEFRDKFLRDDADRAGLLKKVEEIKVEIFNTEQNISSHKDALNLEILYERLKECTGLLDKLLRSMKDLEANYYNVPDPVILVTKKVYPGVVIKIKNQILEVNEELSHVKFKLENGSITWTSM